MNELEAVIHVHEVFIHVDENMDEVGTNGAKTMVTTAQRIPEHLIDQAKHADVRQLAERHAELRRCAGDRELEGPCPKCGGRDRFHCQAEWFFCRQCHPDHGDAIEYMRWMQPGLSFPDAVRLLTGGGAAVATVERRRADPKPAQARQPSSWRTDADRIARDAYACLWRDDGEAGRAYLERRQLEPHVWLSFRLGFKPDAVVPGTKGQLRAPAIVIPWIASTGLFAMRYRFLEPQGEEGHRLTSYPGSDFTGRLYGGHVLPDFVKMPVPDGHRPVERLRTLVICEGEFNAMSIHQVAGETALDVLSIGSQSAHVSEVTAAFAARYGCVLVWADEVAAAQRLMAAVPGAYGVRSPGGKDANDLLREGLLGGFLTAVRVDAAKSAQDLEGLLWNLYDAARLVIGIDTSTAAACMDLARRLGKEVRLVEPEPGRWVAASTLGPALRTTAAR